MGITEVLRRIWLFSAYAIKSSESFSKQPSQHAYFNHSNHVNYSGKKDCRSAIMSMPINNNEHWATSLIVEIKR